MADMTHRAFFGDGERDFKITPELVVELERKIGVGVGALSRRLFNNEFRHADVTETIRIALIGGGTSPQEADALTKAYAANRPIMEVFPLAVSILETLFFGSAKENGKA